MQKLAPHPQLARSRGQPQSPPPRTPPPEPPSPAPLERPPRRPGPAPCPAPSRTAGQNLAFLRSCGPHRPLCPAFQLCCSWVAGFGAHPLPPRPRIVGRCPGEGREGRASVFDCGRQSAAPSGRGHRASSRCVRLPRSWRRNTFLAVRSLEVMGP